MDREWFFLLIGLVLGIPLSIFANIATPWVKSYFKKSSLSIRDRRIYILTTRYRHIKKLKENPTYLVLQGFKNMSWGFIAILLIVAGTTIIVFLRVMRPALYANHADFWWLSDTLFTVIIASALSYGVNIFIREVTLALDFDNYKKKTVAKLKKLGGNPEDLDKEETA